MGARHDAPRHDRRSRVVGAHMAGLPLNGELTGAGRPAGAQRRDRALLPAVCAAGGPPSRPGLLRVAEADGATIAVEVWALPTASHRPAPCRHPVPARPRHGAAGGRVGAEGVPGRGRRCPRRRGCQPVRRLARLPRRPPARRRHPARGPDMSDPDRDAVDAAIALFAIPVEPPWREAAHCQLRRHRRRGLAGRVVPARRRGRVRPGVPAMSDTATPSPRASRPAAAPRAPKPPAPWPASRPTTPRSTPSPTCSPRAPCEPRTPSTRPRAGRDPGPLAGVPFAVKNLFDVEGLPTRAGSRINRERPPAARDAA